jgi:hypothetical protein
MVSERLCSTHPRDSGPGLNVAHEITLEMCVGALLVRAGGKRAP